MISKMPWRRKQQPRSVFLTGEPQGQRSLVGYSPHGCKESDRTQRLNNKGKETHLAGVICNLFSGCPGCCAVGGCILGFRPHLRRTTWGTGWSLQLDAGKQHQVPGRRGNTRGGHQRAPVSLGSYILHRRPGPQEGGWAASCAQRRPAAVSRWSAEP